jgi:hypothetical protein
MSAACEENIDFLSMVSLYDDIQSAFSSIASMSSLPPLSIRNPQPSGFAPGMTLLL